jgi:uncharacterized protein involved in outer membrane biogenesis
MCQSLNNQSQKSLYILFGLLLSILMVETPTHDSFNNYNPTISSIVQIWSLIPAAIAGVLGWGFARLL